MKKVFIAGATGGIGSAIVFECIKQNVEVIAFAKHKQKLEDMFSEQPLVHCIAGDALQEKDVLTAAKGADLIIHAINFPYQKWQATQMLALQHLLHAAKQEQIPFIMIDNIYAYSKSNTPISEQAEKNTDSKKGRLRIEMEQLIKTSGVNYLICHIPDVYGPRAVNSVMYMMLQDVIKNKPTFYMAKLDTLREYAYTDDVAKTVIELCKRPSCYMQNWNIAGALRITGYDLLAFFRQHFGYRQSFKSVSSLMLSLIGIVSPVMREVKELFYLYEQPQILDGSKVQQELGQVHFSNLEKSLIETYNWSKNKA